MRSITADLRVCNFLHFNKTNDKFCGSSLHQILVDGLSTMETISNQMLDLLNALREQFPRLCFLSDREVIQLLSFHPTPVTLQPLIRKCFEGVHWLKVDSEIPCNTRDVKTHATTSGSHQKMKVLGVFAPIQECITFLSPLEPNLNALVWLSDFEKQLKVTMVHLLKRCAVAHNQIQPSGQDLARDRKGGDILVHIVSRRRNIQPVLDLLSEHPLQCLLVAEEAVWCAVVQQAFQESSPVKLSDLKAYNSAKLRSLGCSIRDGMTGAKNESLVSKYMMLCLRALVQLTMNHTQQLARLTEVQCMLESSFEWLSLMKYHVRLDQSLKVRDEPTCYVDVLGHNFQYGYEYFGPEDLMVHTPSTDRAVLGILLALTSFRCGFLSGPSMSGKTRTGVQLGKALGRQVVILQCCPSMRLCILQQMLLGALQTGAWLLMDSVDSLTQGVLSSLGQHLADIHQSFCELPLTNDKGCSDSVDPECPIIFTGKSISANLNYGCVLISSKGLTSKVPESLRIATRPVALTHPDYRIIAEVMMASMGFSEAMPLSQRLVSLIDLARDSSCLPDYIIHDQSCYLVLLKKIISVSEIHLKQIVRQREISKEDKRSAAEKTDLLPSHIVRAGASHLAVVQSLMEETAMVKAIVKVILPLLYDHKRASQFCIVFKAVFPIACQFPLFQQHTEEEETNQLKDAVAEELQRRRIHSATEIVCSALTLYQTMKSSQAVLLIGPPGSGKTTCYTALTGALNSLAAKQREYAFENETKGDLTQKALQISASNWNPFDIVVLFPNAMSHDELFGRFCEKRGWQDGAVPKVLRVSERWERTSLKPCNCETKSDRTPVEKWLVMDGEPAGQPGWLDYLTTLCDLDEPFLSLSSGEALVPSQSYQKLLMEITDLSDASPSAVSRCSLVHITGTDVWKAAWKNEMDALYREHRVDQGISKMWNRLSVDLFPGTLSLLKQNILTSAIHSAGEACKSLIYGLQEIMSFARILRALLKHFGKEMEQAEEIPQTDKMSMIIIYTFVRFW